MASRCIRACYGKDGSFLTSVLTESLGGGSHMAVIPQALKSWILPLSTSYHEGPLPCFADSQLNPCKNTSCPLLSGLGPASCVNVAELAFCLGLQPAFAAGLPTCDVPRQGRTIRHCK